METTLTKTPARRLRSVSPFLSSPLDRFFRNDFLDFWNENGFSGTTPSLNIREEKNNYILNLAAPGLKKEDFDINVEGNLLTISCDKETETKENGTEDFSRREYNYSCFSRTVTLPDYAESNKIVAKYTDGILNLTIPKKPEAQRVTSQKIKVQ
ncbi:MAG: Hsp20/alpha crystallin family protein [Bacteroidetes bacterium]|nr:Hsp20/alpha crystallin family protein [Bacteroidota bacterium]